LKVVGIQRLLVLVVTVVLLVMIQTVVTWKKVP